MVKTVKFLILLPAFFICLQAKANYPQQKFVCSGTEQDILVEVVLVNSGDGQLRSKAANQLLSSCSLGVVYVGWYNKKYTTFSSHRRTNGTYLEFIFPSNIHNKPAMEIPAVLRAVHGKRTVARANLTCQSFVR